jgi:hypothetical protein
MLGFGRTWSTNRWNVYHYADARHDISVSIVAKLRDGLDFEFGRAQEIFLFLQNTQAGSPNFLFNGYRASLSGIKGPRCGINHSPYSNMEIEFG